MAVSTIKAEFQCEIEKVWEFAKKLIMKPFVGMYLKKQQAKYIQDLREVLEAKR